MLGTDPWNLRCSNNWESCDTCGATPEQPCQDPDRNKRTREAMGYKAYFADRPPPELPTPDASPTPGTRVPHADGGGYDIVPPAISPSHYSRFAIQPLEFISKNRIGFCEGNVIKYVCRYDAKNGLEDLLKAQRYLEVLIERARSAG